MPFFSGNGLARSRLFDEKVLHRVLVLLEAGAPSFGIEGVTGFDLHGFLRTGMTRSWYSSRCPVGVTVKRSAYLREDVARERQAGWLGQGRGPELVRNAADLHGVRHAVVAGTDLQALLQFTRVQQFSSIQIAVLASSAIWRG